MCGSNRARIVSLGKTVLGVDGKIDDGKGTKAVGD
jgi:hypothetical protein